MFYAEIINGVVNKYPLTIYDIRAMYTNVSWPDQPDASALASYNLYMVYPTTAPVVKRNQTLTEGLPVYNSADMQWQQTWIVTSKGLDQVKKDEKCLLAAYRYHKEVGGFTWTHQESDVPVDSSVNSQTKMTGAYLKALNNKWPNGRGWKFADGVFRSLITADVISLGDALGDHVQRCFNREEELTAVIDSCTDVDSAINWQWKNGVPNDDIEP